MAVNIKKGETLQLSNQSFKLDNVAVGLGWDCNDTGSTMDLDAWAVAINNKGLKRNNLVYFGNKLDSSKNIRHLGDNLTGDGDGDDETILIPLSKLPDNYTHVLVGVTIFRAGQKHQSFKDVKNAFIRVYDTDTDLEICRYQDEFKGELGNYATILFGAFIKDNGEWKFKAEGRGDKISSILSVLTAYSDYGMADNINNNNGGNRKMAVSLSKGGKVSLAKVAADAGISGGLTKILVGLGWDTNRYDGGSAFDLDASAFMLSSTGKVRSEKDFIFYNNLTNDGVTHSGDNRTGDGDGDDEVIKIDLNAIPADVEKVAFTCTIDQADVRNQTFGQVENAYIRVLDEATGTELVRYDLGEDFSVETAIVVAEIYRHSGEWKFNAVGSGFSGGLAALCGNFGIDV